MSQTADVYSQSLLLPEPSSATFGGGRALVSEIRRAWRQGERADAESLLSRHPKLRAEKSVILDLAYEEYCLRLEAGDAPDPDAFCERFPTFKASLRRLIEAHRFLEENSHLLAEGQPVRWPEPEETFLGFSLVRELGRGAFARVFLANEPALGNRRVAVKVSLQGRTEAETLGRINHPNIVPVHSVQQEAASGLTVVCMPYLGNATLCDVLDHVFAGPALPQSGRAILDGIQEATFSDEPARERRSPDAVLMEGTYVEGVIHLGSQLADALACIHALGICHRDLKPSNVLLTPDGRPMLLDFNLSFDERIADNRLGGTLPYMSPEQLLATDLESGAGPSLIDARSDLFSLGMLLYELLTGTHPFGPVPLRLSSCELRKFLLEKHRSQPRPIRALNPQVDRGLARLIERCLAYNPNDRPQSPAELARDLRRFLSPVRRACRWIMHHARIVAAASVLGLSASGFGAYSVMTLPPFDQRMRERGIEAYHEGRYGDAVTALTDAVKVNRTDADVFYYRGRALAKRGKVDDALADFIQAQELQPQEPRNMACMAYCLDQKANWAAAAYWYQRAIESGLVCSARVLNNLGYTYSEINELAKAKATLNRAIELDARLQAPYLNRAKVEMMYSRSHRCFQNPFYALGVVANGAWADGPALLSSMGLLSARFDFDHSPEAGIKDIHRAEELGPPSAYSFWIETYLYAVAAHYDPHWKEVMFRSMEKSIELGGPPTSFSSGLGEFAGDVRYEELMRRPKPNTPQYAVGALLDPMEDQPE